MHRAGTSLVTRGLKSLGIYLGDDFLDAKPDNPTGYWEDRNIVGFNSRVLNVFGLQWKSVALLTDVHWDEPAIEAIRLKAIEYIQTTFVSHPLWGFKDPRTIRLLPFWSSVFQRVGVEDAYVVVIRNPLSVAESLLKRGVDASTSHSLWLLHMVPYLNRIAEKPYVVIDYDLLMEDPRGQLERIADALEISPSDTTSAEIERFVADFVDPELHHNQLVRLDRDLLPDPSVLVQNAYLGLSRLATDRVGPDRSRFWSEWKQIEGATQRYFEANYSVPSWPRRVPRRVARDA
jgi:O-antigen biosynthesis protein